MVLKHSNVACQWLSIGKRSELSKRWKKASQEEVEKYDGLVKIKDREGYWIEQSDMLSKYLRRPSELEMMSASQFAKMYTTSGLKSVKIDDSDADEVSEDETEDKDSVNQGQKHMIEYIITGNNEKKRLPKLIRLQDPLPREPRVLRKRRNPAVLRFHKASRDNQYEIWMLKELMLYTPFRVSDMEDYEARSSELYKKKENWIRLVKSQVMEHLENVEEARYMVEQ